MRYLIAFLCFYCAIATCGAQTISGSWSGRLSIGSTSLRFVLHLKQEGGVWKSSFDSPDQSTFGIPGGETKVDQDSVTAFIPGLRAAYRGKWDGKDAITGIFQQGPMEAPLSLERSAPAAVQVAPVQPVRKRPQMPKPPFPYASEDVEFDNPDKTMHFGGTFTKPQGNARYPALIIISGSGTQDRDGTLFGHKPYLLLADHLTRSGFAVLRVDDRGAGKSSSGDIANITSAGLSYDVEAALDYLLSRPDVDKSRVGLIGHSEGGIIAPMVAARRKEVAALVLWGASAIGGKEINTLQNAYSLKRAGIDSNAVTAFTVLHRKAIGVFSTVSKEELDPQVSRIFNEWKQQQPAKTLEALFVKGDSIVGLNVYKLYHSLYDLPWMKYFLTYDPATDLAKVTCPVLAITGTKDTQVEYESNLAVIRNVLEQAGNKRVTISAPAGLNHFLQTAVTGDDSEYAQIEETMSPVALKIISDWLLKLL